MIDRVGTVCIFVSNQQRAKQFYSEMLGFEVRTDQPLGPDSDARWIAVAPAGAETEVILYLPDENWEHYKQVVGKSQAITFNVLNIDATYSDLLDKGVQFVQEPDRQPWGTYAMMLDSEGNTVLLVEQPAG